MTPLDADERLHKEQSAESYSRYAVLTEGYGAMLARERGPGNLPTPEEYAIAETAAVMHLQRRRQASTDALGHALTTGGVYPPPASERPQNDH